jgi:hypothetical protein
MVFSINRKKGSNEMNELKLKSCRVRCRSDSPDVAMFAVLVNTSPAREILSSTNWVKD